VPLSSEDAALIATLEHVAYPVQGPLETELRDSVHAFVDARRRSGATPERLLVELKELSRSALRKRRLAAAHDDADGSRQLLEQMVRWAIAFYYER